MTDVHVVPLRDLIEHVVPGGLDGLEDNPGRWVAVTVGPACAEVGCPCVPTPELVPNGSGPDGWMYVHHSLDGRENHEMEG